MRIEGGEARGRILQTPQGTNTRPSDGKTREKLFNSLGERVVGARFLDLYAGSGAVGLEALSRGADFVVFVEQEHSALRAIRGNLKILGWENRALVWGGNVRSALPKLDENGEIFDIIFADPPFRLPKEAEEVCARIDALPRLLNNVGVGTLDSLESSQLPHEVPHGILIVQHSHRVAPAKMTHFSPLRHKKAGESMLSFYVPATSINQIN
ncbi:MAG: 16S rRNA (guanine(966)-N(2))-methyltransferase RsmD [Armatimonadetes bacterium]|nr:16S rRNA (guanine(966)-N(2))-methyltransferase RsmD [Armatimonadota bacterium]